MNKMPNDQDPGLQSPGVEQEESASTKEGAGPEAGVQTGPDREKRQGFRRRNGLEGGGGQRRRKLAAANAAANAEAESAERLVNSETVVTTPTPVAAPEDIEFPEELKLKAEVLEPRSSDTVQAFAEAPPTGNPAADPAYRTIEIPGALSEPTRRSRGEGRRGGGGGRLAAAAAATLTVSTMPVAGPARMKRRHWGLILSFFLIVVMPTALAATYLWKFAADQYSATIAFSVRKEDSSSTLDMLGGLSAFTSASSSSDTDVLYAFIRSPEMVQRVNSRLNLVEMYSRYTDHDPVFGYWPDGTIEDLVDYWQRVVTVYYDASTGLIEVRSIAFDPNDAKAVADEIYKESTEMINRLSAIARADATGYAKEDLDTALERLKAAREALTEFRNRTQMVDPAADVQSQMGLLTQLQGELAQALIDSDLLRESVKEGDPRLIQVQRKIDVIQQRIAAERLKFGPGGADAKDGNSDFALVVAEYERLNVDLTFAEAAYTSAMSAYEGAKAEAQRQSRYLAAHIQPTVAESSRYPERGFLLGMVALFLFLAWAIMTLVYYSLRDRH